MKTIYHTVLIILVLSVFALCKKKDDTSATCTERLVAVTDTLGTRVIDSFEYDATGRLYRHLYDSPVKVDTYYYQNGMVDTVTTTGGYGKTFKYSNGKLVCILYYYHDGLHYTQKDTFIYAGNNLVHWKPYYNFYVNGDEYYEYDANNNDVKDSLVYDFQGTISTSVIAYTYDDKTNPLKGLDFNDHIGRPHNITLKTYKDQTFTDSFEYEYDAQGNPTIQRWYRMYPTPHYNGAQKYSYKCF